MNPFPQAVISFLLAGFMVFVGVLQKAQAEEALVCKPTSQDVICRARCLSNIGDLCLIQRIRFSATVQTTAQPLWLAEFQTCKGARIDLSLKDIFVELKTSETKDAGVDMALISETNLASVQMSHAMVLTHYEKYSAFEGRVSSDQLLNSGNGLVGLEFAVSSCGSGQKSEICKISATVEAVTDPNIRCELRDKTKPGAYLEQRNSINRDRPILLSPYTFN